MRIPDKVRIGGIDYAISCEDTVRNSTTLLYGEINYSSSVIRISKTDASGFHKQCVTLWHEILHGVVEHLGIDLEHSTEEQIVTAISKGVYQVIQDNPSMFMEEHVND